MSAKHKGKTMYYKYRSLKDFKFFVDIIVNNRLYAATYTELNDPMEGRYTSSAGVIERRIKDDIKAKKQTTRICSLSADCSDGLLWAHYADGHKGVVLGITIDKEFIPKKVKYNGLAAIEIPCPDNFKESLEIIFTHKEQAWAYEQEFRVLTDKHFVDISIEKIIFGLNTDEKDRQLIKTIIARLDVNIELYETVRASAGGLEQRKYGSAADS